MSDASRLPERVEAFAPAKLNLGLEVLRRRPDGYHDIETLFQTVDWGDRLVFTRRPDKADLELRITGQPLADETHNTARRAYALLRETRPGRLGGVRVDLDKRIPVGAGLGGGSSDGAAALLALNRLFGLDLDAATLGRLALELGSDVPFFLAGGTAIGRGRGERLEALPPLHRGAFLLVHPGFSVSTAWAYEHLRLGLTGHPYRISVEQVKVYLSRFPVPGMVLKNRLEDVVFPAYPVLSDIVESLEEAGAVQALMSGSGATLFGTFRDREAAARAGVLLAERWQTWVVAPRTQGIGLD
ncbi:MAG: 4-(cytidine 5'-diphospho)-2-C-methyl-D-erythritol kinase [Candidatus Krumholzibacteriia bacterium]|nr:4-(cytidine 5'-diphospho)-2-C-methyl-D-erythritol kinase [Candidatus Latescibacterota bacterium]